MTAGWHVEKLGELVDISLGKTPARATASYWDSDKATTNVWLSIADLLNAEGGLISDSKEYLSDKGAALCKLVPEGTLLVSFKLTLGRVAFAGRDLFTNEAIAALRLRYEGRITKEYLFWYLQFFDWRKAAEGDEKIKGLTLNKEKLKLIEVAYPSLEEQRRIVAILDEAFEGIATAKVNAEKSLESAAAVFESHLQSIFANSSDGWVHTTLGAEIDLLVGFAFKSGGYSNLEDDIRLLRGDNIVQGSLRWEDVKRWSRGDTAAYERYWLREGDVVLAMDRPWVKAGLKHAAISKDDLPCLLVQRTACLRCKPSLNSRFLMYLLRSEAFIRHILGVQTGIGVPHISGQQIKDFAFACPPLADQVRIAERLDELSGHVRRLECTIEKKITALDDLKKSLLHHAFSGQL